MKQYIPCEAIVAGTRPVLKILLREGPVRLSQCEDLEDEILAPIRENRNMAGLEFYWDNLLSYAFGQMSRQGLVRMTETVNDTIIELTEEGRRHLEDKRYVVFPGTELYCRRVAS